MLKLKNPVVNFGAGQLAQSAGAASQPAVCLEPDWLRAMAIVRAEPCLCATDAPPWHHYTLQQGLHHHRKSFRSVHQAPKAPQTPQSGPIGCCSATDLHRVAKRPWDATTLSSALVTKPMHCEGLRRAWFWSAPCSMMSTRAVLLQAHAACKHGMRMAMLTLATTICGSNQYQRMHDNNNMITRGSHQQPGRTALQDSNGTHR